MSDKKVMNRWLIVVGAILIQLCLGAIYAWSVFTPPLTTKTPEEVAEVYSASQMGLGEEEFNAMTSELEDPRAQVKSLSSMKESETDSSRLADIEQQIKAVEENMNATVRAHVGEKRLKQLTYGFNKTQTQIIFALGLLSFAVIMALFAGRWQKKAGPRIVALTGGIVLGVGYLIAGLSGTNFWGILIGVGLLGGAGIGLAYVVPIAVATRWFPDKKGMITGLAVAGFGFGALIWIKLTGGFRFGPVDLTPGWEGLFGMGWSPNQVFILYGILFAVLVGLGALVMKNPPAGWKPKGWVPPCVAEAATTGGRDFSVKQMVATPQFWMLFSTFLVGATSGLMVIGVIKLFGINALTANGISPVRASIIAGTAMALFYALMNGLGRIIWGIVSDKTGRKNAIVLMSVIQGIVMIFFYFIGGHEWGLYVGAAIIGFNFGGNFALFPAATADYFGNKNIGVNYPWVFMAYGVGGLVGPILGGIMGDAQAWMWAFIPAGIACLAAAFLILFLKPPAPKTQTA